MTGPAELPAPDPEQRAKLRPDEGAPPAPATCLHALAVLGAAATWRPGGRLDVVLGTWWHPWGVHGPGCALAPAVAGAVLGVLRRHADAIKRALDDAAILDALGLDVPAALWTPAARVALAELAAVRSALDALPAPDRAEADEYRPRVAAHAAGGAAPWLAALLALDDCAQAPRAQTRARLRARAGLPCRPP